MGFGLFEMASISRGLAQISGKRVEKVINIPTIGGKRPMNYRWAGKVHPSGIEFDTKGFPIFGPHAVLEFNTAHLTGRSSTDSLMTNKFFDLDGTPTGYTWHHHQNGTTLQFVPSSLHNSCRHTGGCAVIRNGGSFD